MRVLADTCIWSLALRRARTGPPAEVRELEHLIRDGRVAIIGPIRQEILSGVRDKGQFEILKSHLAAFPDMPLQTDDYVLAATFFNTCRAKGIQGSNTDFLLCAAAARDKMAIFTTDRDFTRLAALLPITLHHVGTSGRA